VGQSVRSLFADPASRTLLRFHALRAVPPEQAEWGQIVALYFEAKGATIPNNQPVSLSCGVVCGELCLALPLPVETGRRVYGVACQYVGGILPWIVGCFLLTPPVAVPDDCPALLVNVGVLVGGYNAD